MARAILNPESHPALFIVDMQNAYCHLQGTYARMNTNIDRLAAIIPNVVRLRDTARRRGLPIIYTRTSYAPDYLDSGLALESPVGSSLKAMGHLLRDTWDSSIIDQLLPGPPGSSNELVVDKTRASAFFETSLAQQLRALGVTEIILTGVLSNSSIESTAKDAFACDFRVAVISDATATFRQDDHTNSLVSMGWLGPVVTASQFELAVAVFSSDSTSQINNIASKSGTLASPIASALEKSEIVEN